MEPECLLQCLQESDTAGSLSRQILFIPFFFSNIYFNILCPSTSISSKTLFQLKPNVFSLVKASDYNYKTVILILHHELRITSAL